MNLSILCYEDWALMRRAETDKFVAGSYLDYEDVRFYTVQEDICAVMPKPPASALYGKATVSNVPVLLINGEFDPQDPPDNVADALEVYPNSLSLIAPGQGHGYSGFSCREMIVAEFIEKASVDGLSVECLESVGIPLFE
jgi:pimeloyl-ACP methyl ester carboxylesterase